MSCSRHTVTSFGTALPLLNRWTGHLHHQELARGIISFLVLWRYRSSGRLGPECIVGLLYTDSIELNGRFIHALAMTSMISAVSSSHIKFCHAPTEKWQAVHEIPCVAGSRDVPAARLHDQPDENSPPPCWHELFCPQNVCITCG